jgi:hypothetical protein
MKDVYILTQQICDFYIPRLCGSHVISAFGTCLTSNTSTVSNCQSCHHNRAAKVHHCYVNLIAKTQMTVFMRLTRLLCVKSYIHKAYEGEEQCSLTRVTPSLAI